MNPPTTLADPRHEAFAVHLASGDSAASAYIRAGYSAGNARARSQELARDPDIQDRIRHLRTCLPQAAEFKDRFAPSLLLMPETQDQMLAWLWQVMNGTRKILPIQMRAAALFCRMRGWHLTKPLAPGQQPPVTPLMDEERHILATFSRHVVETDLASRPCGDPSLVSYYSGMADAALLASLQNPAQPSPPAPETLGTSASPIVPRPSPHGEPQSPSQNIEPQLLKAKNPQMGTISIIPTLPATSPSPQPALNIKSNTQPPPPTSITWLSSHRLATLPKTSPRPSRPQKRPPPSHHPRKPTLARQSG